jgi:hypothetical protein
VKRLALLVTSLFLTAGCTASRFASLTAGMTQDEVNQVMKEGPTQVTPYEQYSAWSYDGRCVLFKNGVVISKHVEEDERVYTPLVAVSVSRPTCIPPGMEASGKSRVTIIGKHGAASFDTR